MVFNLLESMFCIPPPTPFLFFWEGGALGCLTTPNKWYFLTSEAACYLSFARTQLILSINGRHSCIASATANQPSITSSSLSSSAKLRFLS